jgi:hypothetical protein
MPASFSSPSNLHSRSSCFCARAMAWSATPGLRDSLASRRMSSVVRLSAFSRSNRFPASTSSLACFACSGSFRDVPQWFFGN